MKTKFIMRQSRVLLVLLFLINPVLSLSSQSYDFEGASDTVGWGTVWNSGTSRGTVTISQSNSISYSGSGSLQITINKTDAASDAVNIYYSNLSLAFLYV